MDDGKNVNISKRDIRKEIENLLYIRFGIPEDCFTSDMPHDAFFGEHGLLSPRELTYLSYMLETQYGIQFSEKEYGNPRFYSLSGLSEIISEMTEE